MDTWSLFPPWKQHYLAKVGASLDPSKISVFLSPLISSHRPSLYTSWRLSIQSGLFKHQIPPVSTEELSLPDPLAVFFLVYAATGTALSLALIFTGLVELRLLHAAYCVLHTVVLNHRVFPIS